jgi:chromosome segregation protein
MQGDVFYPAGQVVVRAGSDLTANSLSQQEMEAKLERISKDVSRIRTQIEGFRSAEEEAGLALENHQDRLEQARQELEDARVRLEQIVLERSTIEKTLQSLHGEVSELSEAQEGLNAKLESVAKRGGEYEKAREDVRLELDSVLKKVESHSISFEEAQYKAQLEIARAAEEDAQGRIDDLRDRLELVEVELSKDRVRLERSLEEHSESEAESAETRQSLEVVEEQIATLESEIQPAEESLREAEDARSELEKEETRSRFELQRLERKHSHTQIDLARCQEELASMKRRIEDDFGLVAFDLENGIAAQEPLPFKGLVERLERVDSLPDDTERQVNQLRSQLRRMGPVNPEVKAEYKQVRSRVEFLNNQLDDLKAAVKQIQEVISELDLLMQREFHKTFDAVAAAFSEAFTRLFGGGSAQLHLTEGEGLSQTGIDIEARLPGRREQGLAMLSGGERSLTASALIFALLKVSPTPFAVLDEVDAMLDEVNVVRFREMLEELSQDTQFILITHNRQTVQAAELIYGVSMGSDSTSKVISLNLDEVERAIVG